MQKQVYLIINIFLLALFLLPAKAFPAQQISEDANREMVSQAESFREESAKLPQKSEVSTVIKTAEAPEPAKIQETQATFILKKIILEGNRVFSEAELQKGYAAHLNHPVTFADLKTITDKMTSFYRASGFTLCKAFLPPQKIADGIVNVQIIEGKIRNIVVEGNKFFSAKTYQDVIGLRKDRVFYYPGLENDLVYLNQKPDRSATAYLLPTDQQDLFDLTLKASDTFPVHLNYSFANNGTKLTRRQRHNVSFYNTNLTGHGDILSSTFSMAEEGALAAGSGSYFYTLEGTRTTFSLNTSYVKTHLIGPLKEANIRGKSFSLSPGITQNLFRTLSAALDLFIGIDFKDSKTTADGARVNFDRVRVLKTGPRWSGKDTAGKTTASADVNFGLPGFFGGLEADDESASRPDSGGEFTYYTADLTRIQLLPYASYLTLTAGGQWTDDNLVSPEQFRAGGASSVRGYPESDSAGDSGFNLSAELNLPVPFLPATRVPFSKTTWQRATHLVTFIDSAKTFFRNKSSEAAVKDRFLLGTGFGVRFDLDDHFSLRCDLGFPIGDESSDGKQHAQVHFFVRAGF